jgi:hypothetical protein
MKTQRPCQERGISNITQAWTAARCRWGKDATVWAEGRERLVGVRVPDEKPGQQYEEAIGWGGSWDEAFQRADQAVAEESLAQESLAGCGCSDDE